MGGIFSLRYGVGTGYIQLAVGALAGILYARGFNRLAARVRVNDLDAAIVQVGHYPSRSTKVSTPGVHGRGMPRFCDEMMVEWAGFKPAPYLRRLEGVQVDLLGKSAGGLFVRLPYDHNWSHLFRGSNYSTLPHTNPQIGDQGQEFE